MSVLKYFKNTPGRPHRATVHKCIFFVQIRNEVPGKKKALSPPPSGDRGLSPPQRATGACRPPLGRQALYKPWPPYAVIRFVI